MVTAFSLGEGEYLAIRTTAPRARGLTAAELAVAELAAAGATNEAIAEARGVSVRTVANQLARVFDKLGVARRYQLGAALAKRSGP